MEFNRNINFLRAYCVTAVILFHLDFKFFSNGLLGVDVFFVISGFLITTALAGKNNAAGLASYLGKRALRIIPVQIIMLTATLAVFSAIGYPGDINRLFINAINTISGKENIFLSKLSSYFNPETRYNPLLHMWSLSVEEQFYLIAPFIIIGISIFGKKNKKYIAGIIFTISFAFFIWHPGSENSKFYLLQNRIWEFLAGVLLYYNKGLLTSTVSRSKHFNLSLTTLSIVILILATTHLWDLLSLPHGTIKTIACIISATVLITSKISIYKGVLVDHVGRISYALYIWHYPILIAFITMFPSEFLFIKTTIYLLIVFLISHVSTIYFEEPIRRIRKKGMACIFLALSVAALGLSVFYVQKTSYIRSQNSFEHRIPSIYMGAINPVGTSLADFPCREYTDTSDASIQICKFGDSSSKYTVGLYGDSHAESLATQLDIDFKSNKINGVRFRIPACEPIPSLFKWSNYNPKLAYDQCRKSMGVFSRYVRSNLNGLIVSIRWTPIFFPIEGSIDSVEFNNLNGGKEFHEYVEYYDSNRKLDADAKHAALDDFISDLTSTNVHIYLVAPIPEAGWDIPRYNFSEFLKTGKPYETITTNADLYLKRHRWILNQLTHYSSDTVSIIFPHKIYCDSFISNKCVHQLNYNSLYFDDDHLSEYGAKYLTNVILKEINNFFINL